MKTNSPQVSIRRFISFCSFWSMVFIDLPQICYSQDCPPPIGGPNCEIPYKDCFLSSDCIVCNTAELDGFCFTLSSTPDDDEPPNLCLNPPNNTFDNPSWIPFYATNNFMHFKICPSNCGNFFGLTGIQAGIYPDCPAVPENAIACQGVCDTSCIELFSSDFIIGEKYYLAVDGCQGVICDVTIDLVFGGGEVVVKPINNLVGPKKLCPGVPATYEVKPPPQGAIYYQWKLNGNIIADKTKSITYVFPSSGIYQLCVDGYHECTSVDDPPEPYCIDITVEAIPETNLPKKTVCVDSCFNFDQFTVCGAQGDQSLAFTLKTNPLQCDSIIKFDLVVIQSKQTYLPKQKRCLGDHYQLGDSVYPDCGEYEITVRQKNAPFCDSIIHFELEYINLDIQIKTPDSLGCPPDDQVLIDASKSLFRNCNDTIHVSDLGLQFSWTYFDTIVPNENQLIYQNDSTSLGPYCLTALYQLAPGSNPLFCKDTQCVQVWDNKNADVSFSNSDTLTCVKIPQVYATTFKPMNYSWTGPGGFSSVDSAFQVPGVGTYYGTVTDGVCTLIDSVEIFLDTGIPDIAIQNDTLSCAQPNGIITAFTSIINPTFLWKNDTGTVISNAPTVSVNASGIYQITIAAINGCTATTQVEVIGDFEKPMLSAFADTITCNNNEVLLDGIYDTQGGVATFVWKGPSGAIIALSEDALTLEGTGDYTFKVIGPNGCFEDTTINVPGLFTLPDISIGEDTLTCIDTTAILSANSSINGATFQWYDAKGVLLGNTNSQLVTASGNYLVAVQHPLSGCKDTMSATAWLKAEYPSAHIHAYSEILNCDSTNLHLFGENQNSNTPNVHFAWTGPGTTSTSQNILINQPGTYFLEVIETVSGCKDTAQWMIQQNINPPDVVAMGGVLDCFNKPKNVLLSGNSSVTKPNAEYHWTNTAGAVISDNDTVSVFQQGVYYFTVKNLLNGCSNTDTALVLVDANTPDVITSVSDTMNCNIKAVTISASSTTPGVTYIWTGPDIIGSNPNPIISDINQPGIYTVIVLNPANQCEQAMDIEVYIDTIAPIAFIQSTDTLTCLWADVELIGNGTGNDLSYQWYAGSTPLGNTATQKVNTSGDYLLQITNLNNGCIDTAQVHVYENKQLPFAEITGGAINCNTKCITMIGNTTTGNSYIWSGPGIDAKKMHDKNQIICGPGVEGVYKFATVAPNGCVNQDTALVVEDLQTPQNLNVIGDTITCIEDTVIIQLNTSTSACTYLWTGSGINAKNQYLEDPFVSKADLYKVLVTAPNGCTELQQVFIDENKEKPIVVVSQPTGIDCLHKTSILSCAGSSQGSEFIYQWTGPESGSECVMNATMGGVYTLTILNTLNGCSDSQEVKVIEKGNIPVGLVAQAIHPKCVADQNGVITINQVIGGTPPFQYSLDGISFTKNPAFTGLGAGKYNVKIQDALGCEYDQEFYLDEPDPLLVELGDNQLVNWGDIVTISAQIYPLNKVKKIQWNTSIDSIDCIGPQDSCHLEYALQLFQETVFNIDVTDSNGCKTSDQVIVFVKKDRPVYIPNVFSPDGNGDNDRFVVFGGYGVVGIEKIQIFDRWGQQVFVQENIPVNDPSVSWDGRVQNQMSNPGVYVYLLYN